MAQVSKSKTSDKSMINVSKHLAYIFMESMVDVLGYRKKRIEKFEEEMDRYRLAYNYGSISSVKILNWGQDNKVFVLARIKEIPMRTKLMFGDIKGNNGRIAGIDKNIEAIMLADITLACMVLHECFKETYSKCRDFLKKVIYLVDSYTRYQPKTKITYLNDNLVREMMIEEIGYDFSKKNKSRLFLCRI